MDTTLHELPMPDFGGRVVLVRPDAVVAIRPDQSGTCILIMQGGEKIEVALDMQEAANRLSLSIWKFKT
jgi:hypothetical protein